jgi:glycosyltransferase involved in cell wall biosynthesis
MISPARHAVAQFPPPGRSTNPYAELLYPALEGHGMRRSPFPDLTLRELWRSRRTVACLHFNWRPDRYYAPSLSRGGATGPVRYVRALSELIWFALLLAVARATGYRIGWTVHEVFPPRPDGGWRRIDVTGQRVLARLATSLFAHDAATADRFRAELRVSRREIAIVPHGSFVGVYPRGRSGPDVRRTFGIAPESFVFLCFGQLRSDKELRLLVDSFAAASAQDLTLVIAGAPEDEHTRLLVENAARGDARIRALPYAVPDDRVAELFEMADAFVLARSEPWTSGSLILALSLGRPAVVARVPSTVALLGDERAGWLFDAGDGCSLTNALERAAADRDAAIAKRAVALDRARALPPWSEIASVVASRLRG